MRIAYQQIREIGGCANCGKKDRGSGCFLTIGFQLCDDKI